MIFILLEIYIIYNIYNFLLPNSDILHILKCVRRKLLKADFIFIDYFNNITISVDEFAQYNLMKIIEDNTSHGGMKDSYPLLLYSFEVFKEACNRRNFAHAFYLLPYVFIAESVRNPILSNNSRLYYLEVAFWVIFYFFNQSCYVKSHGVHSKIGHIRTLNTIITICISIIKYGKLKLSRLSTHPLECFFGIVRLACYGNHNLINVIRAIAKSVLIKNKLIELNEDIQISGRDNIGGTSTDDNIKSGVTPQCTPNQFFCLMLRLMKGFKEETDINILNQFITDKINENNNYSKNFMKIYLQGPFAGSSIPARYRNNSEKKKKSAKIPQQCENDNDINEEEEVEEMIRPDIREPNQEDFDIINLMMGDVPEVINFYSSICPNGIYTGFVKRKNQRKENFFKFAPEI